MADEKSKILNTTVCIIYMLFGFAFAEAPQPGTVLACELYPDVHPGTIDTTGSFNQLVAIWENLIGKTYISEEQILKYIQEAPLPFNFELSINHSVVIKGNHTNFQIQRSSFVIKASELYQLDLQAAIEKEKELTESLNVANEEKKKLEEQIATLEKKCSDSDAKHAEKVAELVSELEEFQKKASTLEISLQAAIEKENELTVKYEEASKSSGEKLIEAENLVEVLRIELSTTQENLKSVENDLQAAGLRESEIMEKLKSVGTRKTELEETNLKLTQELAATVSEKDETFKQLQTSKKLVEDLEQKFQAQIASLLEENNLLKEKLKEAEISEKSILQSRVKELEEQLVTVESQLKQEVESVKADFAEKVREGDVLKEQRVCDRELNELKKVIDDGASVFTCFVSAIGKIIFW